jgi:hypothetical protein
MAEMAGMSELSEMSEDYVMGVSAICPVFKMPDRHIVGGLGSPAV